MHEQVVAPGVGPDEPEAAVGVVPRADALAAPGPTMEVVDPDGNVLRFCQAEPAGRP